MNKIQPKVSVVTITYGHEKYIEDTLNGVIMQQYKGPVEFIIANDHSPDETDAVVKQYLATHVIPKNIEIKYSCHTHNKGVIANFFWALKQATGTFVAICEGDDYWTDPLKLQKQVFFLENNPKCNLVYHPVLVYDEEKKNFLKDYITRGEDGIDKSLIDLALTGNFMHTPSVIFRNNINYHAALFNQPVGDYVVWFLNGEKGDYGYLSDEMSVYRFSEKSTWGKKAPFFRVYVWLKLLLKLKNYSNNASVKSALAQQSIEHFIYGSNSKLGIFNQFKLFILAIRLNKKNFKIIIGIIYSKLTK